MILNIFLQQQDEMGVLSLGRDSELAALWSGWAGRAGLCRAGVGLGRARLGWAGLGLG